MSLTFIAGSHAEAGGLAVTVTEMLPASVAIGDLIVTSVLAQENGYGTAALINKTGATASYTSLFTDGTNFGAPFPLQYMLDDGHTPRVFWWAGYKIALAADTGGATQTFNCTSGSGLGVGVACASVVYRNPGSATPFFSFASRLDASTTTHATDLSPSTTTPSSTTGTFTWSTSITQASFVSAATFVMFGDASDYYALSIPIGLGGTGVWLAAPGLTTRLTAGGAGGPWYMTSFGDAVTSGFASLGRLPLLGAG
jgi:hypothetical protein